MVSMLRTIAYVAMPTAIAVPMKALVVLELKMLGIAQIDWPRN